MKRNNYREFWDGESLHVKTVHTDYQLPNYTNDIEIPWNDSGIQKRHSKRIETDHADWLASFETARAAIARGGIIALTGKRGTGKTQLAAWLIRWMIEQLNTDDSSGLSRRPDSKYFTAQGLFLHIRKGYAQGENESNQVHSLIRPELLVIDEVQERRGTDWENAAFVNIVDQRYARELPTVLIGNLQPQAFLENVGNSIADRMNEGGGIIEMNWQSFRGTP